jgi:hypothetical protein
MSTIAVNTITDASGGNTASINGATPTTDNTTGKNRLINGDMRIDARNAGAAVTADGSYAVDRFYSGNSTDGAFSAQQDSSAPAGFANSLKVTTTTADGTLTTTQALQLRQGIEGTNIADLGWGSANAKTVTLSFWVRSSLTGSFGGSLRNSGATRSYPFSYTISVADTWEYKTVTILGDTSGTWLTTNGLGIQVIFGLGVGPDRSGTAGAWTGSNVLAPTGATSVIGTLNATWYITGVQLEAGSVATSFERRSYGQELALCQRYCFATINSASSTGSNPPLGFGNARSSTNAYIQQKMPVTMRTSPSVTVINPTSFYLNNTSNVSTTGISLDISGLDMAQLNVSVASGLTSTLPYSFLGSNANGQLIYSAEL